MGHVHEADKKNKNELEGREWTGGMLWSLGANGNMRRGFKLIMPLLGDDRERIDQHPKPSQLICS